MAARILARALETTIVIFSIGLANATAFSFTLQFPGLEMWNGLAWSILRGWLVVAALILVALSRSGMPGEYLSAWKRQPFLIAFVLLALLSLSWTSYLEASLYKSSVMLLASLAAAYLAVRHGLKGGLQILGIAGMFFIVGSLALLIWYPPYARLDNYPYYGAWRGIFWHRNHFGGLMALFSAVFLLKLLASGKRWASISLNSIFLALSAAMVWASRSATGMVLLVVLTASLVTAALWLRLRPRLGKMHYLMAGSLALALGILILLNTEFIFGLLGRSSTLTGRIPLWADLLGRVWVARPFAGYGFGALWMDESFRISMQARHGWPYQVFFADNGYLDILLNTGAAGLGVFLGFFVSTGIRSFKSFLASPGLISFFPFLICLFVLIANISYSFLLEVDQFVWMLLVLAAFWSDQIRHDPREQTVRADGARAGAPVRG